jgi:hypothetical protein
MTNLTEKQQTIIADITNEFIKVNADKKTIKKGSLLRIYELVGQRDIDLENRYEIELYNKSMFVDFVSLVDDAIDTLNEELIDYGLKAFRFKDENVKQNLEYIYFYIDLIDNANTTIQGNGNSNNFSKYFIRLVAKNKLVSVGFKSGISSIYKYKMFNGFAVIDEYGSWGVAAYKTIEDLALNSDLRNRINNFVKYK